jgi:hypothetical protein
MNNASPIAISHKTLTHTYEIDVLHGDYKMLSMRGLPAPTQKQMAASLREATG